METFWDRNRYKGRVSADGIKSVYQSQMMRKVEVRVLAKERAKVYDNLWDPARWGSNIIWNNIASPMWIHLNPWVDR